VRDINIYEQLAVRTISKAMDAHRPVNEQFGGYYDPATITAEPQSTVI
jgi:hypothetical protein